MDFVNMTFPISGVTINILFEAGIIEGNSISVLASM